MYTYTLICNIFLMRNMVVSPEAFLLSKQRQCQCQTKRPDAQWKQQVFHDQRLLHNLNGLLHVLRRPPLIEEVLHESSVSHLGDCGVQVLQAKVCSLEKQPQWPHEEPVTQYIKDWAYLI